VDGIIAPNFSLVKSFLKNLKKNLKLKYE